MRGTVQALLYMSEPLEGSFSYLATVISSTHTFFFNGLSNVRLYVFIRTRWNFPRFPWLAAISWIPVALQSIESFQFRKSRPFVS
jgi:hypothetical protein